MIQWLHISDLHIKNKNHIWLESAYPIKGRFYRGNR